MRGYLQFTAAMTAMAVVLQSCTHHLGLASLRSRSNIYITVCTALNAALVCILELSIWPFTPLEASLVPPQKDLQAICHSTHDGVFPHPIHYQPTAPATKAS